VKAKDVLKLENGTLKKELDKYYSEIDRAINPMFGFY
jgi:hypothetical protein